MPRLEPRTFTIQQDLERQLRPLMSSEAVEVLARVMADLIARDTRQFTALTDLFKDAFSKEYDYIQQQRRHRTAQDGVS